MTDIRKIVTWREVTFSELRTLSPRPIVRAVGIGVIRNPFAGRFAEDLRPLYEAGAALGERLMPELVRLLDGPAVSYGKGAIVGVAGEMEHGGACVHPMLGRPMRAAVGGGQALISSNVKVAAPGTPLDVPLGHKDDAWSFAHFDTITVFVADAPRPDEIAVVIAIADGGGWTTAAARPRFADRSRRARRPLLRPAGSRRLPVPCGPRRYRRRRAGLRRASARPARCSAEACTNTSLPPPSRTMKPNPLVELYHLTVPVSWTVASSGRPIADGRRGTRRCRGGRGDAAGAGVDADHLGDLRPALPLGDPHFERVARLDRGDPVAAQHRRMQERVARAVRQFDEAEPLFRFEPFDDGTHRRPRGLLETRRLLNRGAAPKSRGGGSNSGSSKLRRRLAAENFVPFPTYVSRSRTRPTCIMPQFCRRSER